jgi:glutamate-ammonia-ligase adenylyltransferase
MAQRSWDRLIERDQTQTFRMSLEAAPELRPMLFGVFGCSPYLGELASRDPARLARLLLSAPEDALDCLVDRALTLHETSEASLMQALRLLKQEAALLVALADLLGVWETMTATRALTRFADATLAAAVSFTLREAAAAGRLTLADPCNPARASGWIFLGMGKTGAHELNYSSDIDLIVLTDRRRLQLAKPDDGWELFVRLTQRAVKIMSERTADGYVFRVDLRLRPDPGATPVAIPLEAAYAYYESMGQNWERAAFVKARAVAGDIEAGEEFLRELTSFVWRKYFDFAALADVHSIKRQIHAHKGHATIAVNGHNVKLGRGGIREIEFFVQTQQLILGGRDPRLRARETLQALDLLLEAGWIETRVRDELRDAYLFLRDVEHRIQMIADEQRHTLPETDEGVDVVAKLMGFAGYAQFAAALRQRMETVQGHYARLFEAAPDLSGESGNLVFTGDEDDPETIVSLERLGFVNAATVTASIRAWHFGRYAATRSERAQERLTELTPALLQALAETGEADAAFLAFDKFMSRLPAGVQLFSLLVAHPRLLRLLATIMGAAPKLADTISRRPRVLGALLDPAPFELETAREALSRRLAERLGEARSYEDALNLARIFGQEQKFRIGVRLLTETLAPRAAGRAYAALAEAVIAELLRVVEAEFAKAHGIAPHGAAAVVALGKLGGREMTAASDLDLMLLYDCDPRAESIGGERPLPAPQYYTRLTQRLIAALSAPTAEGLLYEVDFRLRPSGNKGPIAVRLAAFEDYQANEAWTWEHMALTRARVVAGPPEFAERVEQAIRAALLAPRDPEKLAADVRDMRRRLEREKGGRDLWNLKQAPGGQIDVEFIVQYLLLKEAPRRPECLATSVVDALALLAEHGALGAQDAQELTATAQLYQTLTQILRLSIDGDFQPSRAPRGLTELLLRAAGEPDMGRLEAQIAEIQRGARAHLRRILQF